VTVDEAVGRALAELGLEQVFGVVGSGNFHVTNALVHAGGRFVAARHEGGAATMADAYSRMSGTVAALSVHQGCGLTNAMTGITEAAKSRTPMLVLAAEVTNPLSNFYVDQPALAGAVGAVGMRVASAETALADTAAAYWTARHDRRTVVLNLPLDVQRAEVPTDAARLPDAPDAPVPSTDPDGVARLAAALAGAERPVFVAGRGARGDGCREALEALAERSGALVATSAVANGLFHGNPWSLGISGGFASPLTAELIRGADVIVGWGCALNMWTMSHGALIGPDAMVVQVDVDADALGRNRPITFGVVGDVGATATACAAEVRVRTDGGYRTPDVGRRIAERVRWRDVPTDDRSTAERIDPRVLSAALDDLLPAQRIVATDSGNFQGYPSAYLTVPDEYGFCMTQAYQSIGLGLATTIGAALARPDRLPVAALGDGGALMGVSELDTVVRLGLPMVVVVYNDDGYGAEVHHFGPDGHDLGTVVFPDTDIAAIARGFGFAAATVRTVADLDVLRHWLSGDRSAPLLLDAKVVNDEPSWWLEEAFGGH
jgi:thiamine pyrophosphate-dependent acetolactate synthase large subunit-like protein